MGLVRLNHDALQQPCSPGAPRAFRRLGLLALSAVLCSGVPALAEQRAPVNEVRKTEYFLERLEKNVLRKKGQTFKPGYDDNEALRRVKALKEQFPDDPDVEQLFQRARAALMQSKGDFIKITPEMLTYRQNEGVLRQLFAREADEAWKGYRARVESTEGAISIPFPPPSHREVSIDDMIGRQVILEDFEYPTNEFTSAGRQFVFVGSGSRGYYFVELSNRAWLGAYEAIKRYRRFVNPELPEGGKWTLVGTIRGIELLIPQAGKKKTASCAWGWSVEPRAIFVPGQTFAIADGDLELGGSYAGEDRADEIKVGMYTVREVPGDVTPDRLVEIFATAIKEKNYKLYLDCIDPGRRQGSRVRDRLLYHWEWHQKRFAEFYVHVEVEKAKIEVISGQDVDNDLDNFFLSDEQKETVGRIAGELVEQATVWSKAYDEQGRQYGSPKPHFLKRTGGAKGRWYITNYPQPF